MIQYAFFRGAFAAMTSAVQMVKYDIPDMTGLDANIDLFQCTGRVAVYIFAMTGDGIEGSYLTGPELIVNGTFTGNADGWGLGTGWSYSADKVVHDPGQVESLYQVGDTPAGWYYVSFDAPGTGGSYYSVGGSGEYQNFSAGGTYSGATQSYGGSDTIRFYNDDGGAFDGSIDNVSVKERIAALITVGIDDLPSRFLSRDVTAEPLNANCGWQQSSELPVGEFFGGELDRFYYIDGDTIRLFVAGELTQGSVRFFAHWFPLEDGATVTSLEA
jgi:hypothetical protein